MTYYHVLWTKPYFKPGVTAPAEDIVLWDFEFLIWLLSALQARRHGLVGLVTDSRGALAAERAGLASFYNGGISTALDAVPDYLDTDVFWAGGKLYAYDVVQPPCVFMDMDAVLWKPLNPVSPVMGLHREGKDWAWYRDNRQEYCRFGFEDPDWNWDLDPFNTGVIYLGSSDVSRYYARTACEFAERYSRQACPDPVTAAQDSNTMLFAEQRLLTMCAARHGIAVEPVIDTAPLPTCLPRNPDCLHLWRSKLAYKICADARLALVNWAIDYLLEHFPESRPVLARWNLHLKQEFIQPREVDPAEFRVDSWINVTGGGDVRSSLTHGPGYQGQ